MGKEPAGKCSEPTLAMWASTTGCTLGLGGAAGADVGSVTVTFFPLLFFGCFGGMIK